MMSANCGAAPSVGHACWIRLESDCRRRAWMLVVRLFPDVVFSNCDGRKVSGMKAELVESNDVRGKLPPAKRNSDDPSDALARPTQQRTTPVILHPWVFIPDYKM